MPDSPDFDQELRLARSLLRSNDADQVANGERILREVIDRCEGTWFASAAWDLLMTHQELAQTRLAEDPAMSRLRETWQRIHEVDDSRLVTLLGEVQPSPLRLEILELVGRWLAEVPVLDVSVKASYRARLQRLVGRLREIGRLPSPLEGHLSRVERDLFLTRLGEIDGLVDGYLERWELDPAREAIADLHPPPGEEKKVQTVHDKIRGIAALRSRLESLIEGVPPRVPRSWSELTMLVETAGEIRSLTEPSAPPPDWTRLVDDAIGQIRRLGQEFLDAEARTLSSVGDAAAFFARFEAVQDSNASLLAWDDCWIEDQVDGHLASVLASIATAEVPEELETIHDEFLKLALALPDLASRRIQRKASAIQAVAEVWVRALSGRDFDVRLLEDNEIPRCEAFTLAVKQADSWRREIEKARQSIEASDGESEAPLNEARLVAKRILRKQRDHVGALALEDQVRRGLNRLLQARAFAEWDVDGLAQVLVESDSDRSDELVPRLHELAGLVHRGALRTVADAGAWWTEWAHRESEMPPVNLGGLEAAIRSEEARRREQTTQILERMLEADPTIEECEKVIERLTGELSRAGLDSVGHLEAFRERLALLRGRAAVEAGDWRAVEEILQGLPASRAAVGLECRLHVARAREKGLTELAEVLATRWLPIVAEFGTEAEAILLESLDLSLSERDRSSHRRLRAPLERAIAEPAGGGPSNELVQWKDWLDLEPRLLQTEVPFRALSELLNYSACYPTILADRHIDRLAAEWETDGRLDLVAWAYEAFHDRSSLQLRATAEHPIEALVERSRAEAREAQDALATKSEISAPEVRSLVRQLQCTLTGWSEYRASLEMLSRPPAGPVDAPPELGAALALARTLLDAIDELDRHEASDVRSEYNRLLRLERRVQNELSGVSMTSRMRERVARLIRLASVQADVMEIERVARECGDLRQVDRNTEPFAALAGAIDAVVAVFDEVGMRDRNMWNNLSRWAEQQVRAAACVDGPLSSRDMAALAQEVRGLDEEERLFKKRIGELADGMPVFVSRDRFDPANHRDYLQLFPPEPPRTARTRELMRKLIDTEVMGQIIDAAKGFVPRWVEDLAGIRWDKGQRV